MSNVLGDNTQQQVLALGRLGWWLRRIEEATAVRRETASAYLKAAKIPVRERGGRPRVWPPKPATTRRCPPTPVQNRPPRRGCPPTLDRQNRQFPTGCPPTPRARLRAARRARAPASRTAS